MDTIAPFRITICGIEELEGHNAAGVSHVLSILDPEWPVPEAFGGFGEHEKLELRFHDVIEDVERLNGPREAHVGQLLRFGRSLIAEPPAHAHLLVHCHAGVSRSTASMTLILAEALPERPASEILDEVLRIRDKAWPNLHIVEMGDAMLGRGGTLVAATHLVYARQLAKRPWLAEEMTRMGRGREVEAGRAAAGSVA